MRLVHAFIWFPLVAALRLSTTPLNLFAGCLKGHPKVILLIFRSIKMKQSANIFRDLFRLRTLPIDRLLLQHMEPTDLVKLSSILFKDITGIEKLTQVERSMYWLKLIKLQNSAKLAKIVALDGCIKPVEGILKDHRLLSTARICEHFGKDEKIDGAMWNIVDGECLVNSNRYATKDLVQSLIGMDSILNFDGPSRLGPILRIQQFIVAYEYMHTYSEDVRTRLRTKLKRRASYILQEFRGGPPQYPQEVHCHKMLLAHLQDSMQLLESRINFPRWRPKYDDWLLYFNWVWLKLQTISSKGADLIGRNRAMINCMALASIFEMSERFLLSSKIGFILSQPKETVPSRDLYTLMITLLHDRLEASIPLARLIWDSLVQSGHSEHELLTVTPSHFGVLAQFSGNETLKAVFRFHAFSERHIRMHHMSADEAKTALIDALTENFMAFSIPTCKYPVLIPKIEIHPYSEVNLSSLFFLALLYRVPIPIRLHCIYYETTFARIFSEGKVINQLIKCHLTELIIERQFISELPSIDQHSMFESLKALDTLHLSIKFEDGGIIPGTLESYQQFLNEVSINQGNLARIVYRDGQSEFMKNYLMRIGAKVWFAKTLDGIPRLPIVNCDPEMDTQFLFFKS